METSDWLLYGGLLVANASGGLNAISTAAGTAVGFLATLAGWAALAVAAGAGMKLAGK